MEIYRYSYDFVIKPLVVPPGIWVPPDNYSRRFKRVFRRLMKAYPGYCNPTWWSPTVVDPDTYRLTAKYVSIYSKKSGDPVWKYIARPSIQGVSLLFHEAEELRWFLDKRLQAFKRDDPQGNDYRTMVVEYTPGHATGLIAEHRYNARRAFQTDHDFRLGELILWNPIAGDPDYDLDTVKKYRCNSAWNIANHNQPWRVVQTGDLEVRQDYEDQVRTWYHTQHFQGPL